MDHNYESKQLDWQSYGYFAFSNPPTTQMPSPNSEAGQWLSWEMALDRAKKGDFSELPKMIELYKNAKSYKLRYACSMLLGDAGTSTCFQLIIRELEASPDSVLKIDFCDALASWGKLSVAPILLRVFDEIRSFKDSDIIPTWLSDLLEQGYGAISDLADSELMDDYRNMVMVRYNELQQRFGSDQVLVFNGELFSVVSFAKLMLRQLNINTFDTHLRRKFEASTGIDCTNFYKNKVLQPLFAAGIIEDFLESPAASKYQDGVRYFFGHRIPD